MGGADHPAAADQRSATEVPAVVERRLPGHRVVSALVPADNAVVETQADCEGTRHADQTQTGDKQTDLPGNPVS